MPSCSNIYMPSFYLRIHILLNVLQFGENLLMAAIRANQQEMAEFLLDNGVDPNFEATLVVCKNI